MPYDHISIEKKWQKYWDENKTFKTENPPAGTDNKNKKYILDMFPYPSGAGLHVGHPKGYTATDIVSRYYHATGHNVLHTMGFDAFGLPAENYAIKTGTHPAVTTAENIQVFIQQLKGLGFSYDWDRMVDTTDPTYYQWTQWIFLELFKKGLAYEQDLPINYCPSCKTGLANEEVTKNNTCDRCGAYVERKKIRQWVLRITDYAERLLADIDTLDWPEGIKEMQRNWIGKSEGCEFRMQKDIRKKNEDGYRTDAGGCTKDNTATTSFLIDSIYKSGTKVKKKDKNVHFSDIDVYTKTQKGIIHFVGKDIQKHFSNKSRSEISHRKSLRFAVIDALPYLVYESDEVGYCIYKEYILRVVLKKISEDKYIVKTFYIAQTLSKVYTQYIESIPTLSVYTTRVDTVYGMTYVVMAPDHPHVHDYIVPHQHAVCTAYIEGVKGQSDIDRTNEGKEKTGVYTGSYVVNPFNGESVPVWIADYVLGSYGTGAVMAVPAHDERDMEFARRYDLPIRQSIVSSYGDRVDTDISAYTDDGILYDSGTYTGTSSADARHIFSEKAESEGFGHKKINYKLRDWLFSRQRYWGEPIPLIHISLEDYARIPRAVCTGAYIQTRDSLEYLMIDSVEYGQIYDGISSKIIIDTSLPLTLPRVEKYEPAGDGLSPLATVPDWVHVQIAENLTGKRETNTMPQWGGSCWYYLRYMDPRCSDAIASPSALDYWESVDEYVGGAEHAVLHLLYARFWHKVLYDIGAVPTLEPFQKLTNVGMILAYAYERADGSLVAVDMVEERGGIYYEKNTENTVKQVVAKMSKSLKNVVNPNDIVAQYGADTLRLYEMSMSAFTDTAPWNPDAIIGVRRFLDKAYSTILEGKNTTKDDMRAMKTLHKTIKKVGEDIVEYKFNTAISALQILLNEGIPTDPEFATEWAHTFTTLLHPFAPHMAEEIHFEGKIKNEKGGIHIEKNSTNEEVDSSSKIHSIYNVPWPTYEDYMLVDDEVTIAIQVNGKLRGTYTGLNGVMQDEVSVYAHSTPEISRWLDGKILKKEIFIPNKLLSIVVGE